MIEAVKALGVGPADSLSQVHLMSHMFLYPSADTLTPGVKGPFTAPGGPLPALLLWQLRGSRLDLPNALVFGCHAGRGMPNLGCCAGLHIWRRAGVLSRTRGWVGYSPTCTVNETMAEPATAPTPASLETQFGPEVLGASCKPCLEQTKPRADCLWISALLPTQTYAGGKNKLPLSKSSYRLQLSCR